MGRRYRRGNYNNSIAFLIALPILIVVYLIYMIINAIITFIVENKNEIVVFLICLLILSLVFAFTIIFILFINKRYTKFVNLHSVALNKLRNINLKYNFVDAENFVFSHSYDNENYYMVISPKDYLIYQLMYKINETNSVISKVKHNRALYTKYISEVDSINSFNIYNVDKLPIFKKLLAKKESKIYHSEILKPLIQCNATVNLYLTKINGVYRDSKSEVFNEETITIIINKLLDRKGDYYNDPNIWESICRVERGRVSNKIRFLVYKRDNNRCVKCGSRYNLEVDHIYPISKGGKSTVDNLQTLCHNCNQIKSNNIEFGAIDPKLKKRETGECCPLCGAKLVVRYLRRGSFIGCSAFPNCKYTRAK